MKKYACQTPARPLQYTRECNSGQRSPTRPALTSDWRKAVTSRVSDTAPPPAGHGAPFIRSRARPPTINHQLSNLSTNRCAFITLWKYGCLEMSTVHDPVHGFCPNHTVRRHHTPCARTKEIPRGVTYPKLHFDPKAVFSIAF